MIKRWIDLPRIAICSLTLASVVALGLNAYAGTLRNAGSRTSTTVHAYFGPPPFNASVVGSVTTTATPPPVTFFSSMGSGLATYGDNVGTNPQSDCTNLGFPINGSDQGNCVESTGIISDGSGSFTSGSYVVVLDIDESSAFNNGGGLDCFAATGEVLFPKGTGGIQGVARLLTSGIACVTPNFASSVYNGGFSVTGSTGIFSGAGGTGSIDFSIDNNSTTDGINYQSYLYVTGAQTGL